MNKLLTSAAAVLLLAACSGTGGDEGGEGAAQPGSSADFVQNAGDKTFFNFDSSTLTHQAQAGLDRQAAWLLQYPNANVTLEGHCDERGTEQYNLVLGEKRAHAARHYLVSLGVKTDRLKTISFGKSKPLVPGSGEEIWAQNRVVVTALDAN